MRAIDTNVVVRFFTGDDHRQALASRKVIEAGSVFVPLTVVLETDRVLRSGAGFSPDQIADGLVALLGLPGVTVELPERIAAAIDGLRTGMDFADALHLASAEGCEAFLSFDHKLMKAAAGRGGVPVVSP